MKAEELMIGDWLMLNQIPRKVVELTEDYIELAFYQKPGDVISPITLTPEILEKNGYRHEYEKNRLGVIEKYVYDKGFANFTVWLYKGRWELGQLGNLHIKYIHQLQHALRLCGLAEIADNIKIE